MILLHKSSLKLAGLYLAILMAISLLFSISIYQASARELERSLRRPTPVFNTPSAMGGIPNQIRAQFQAERSEAYEEAKERILMNLLFVNMAILIVGGLLSYYLALRTLKPIEDAHAAQSRFASNASHELRTPITAMRSENEVALMDPNLSLSDAKALLGSNIEELLKLTTLTEGLLRLAQTEESEHSAEKIGVAELIKSAVGRLIGSANKKSITIEVTGNKKVSVYGDAVGLSEIIATLLDNAIKYSPKASKITIQVEVDEQYVHIHVIDRGPGIAKNEIPFIFDRFYRADSSRTKQKTGGYGLGLAIAKGIADTQNARLSVESKQNNGSKFTLSIPLSD